MNTDKIKFLREELNLTQQDVADLLNIKRSTYSGYENKIDNIPLNRFYELCNILHTSMDYIIDISTTNKYIKSDNKFDIQRIANKMRETRIKNNNLEKDLANILGIDISTYSRYENAITTIQTEYLIAFVKHYKISLDWICK